MMAANILINILHNIKISNGIKIPFPFKNDSLILKRSCIKFFD